ncbi:MAG: ankyrin repeat domain-containing protein [Candidatus Dependentiae bacterium]
MEKRFNNFIHILIALFSTCLHAADECLIKADKELHLLARCREAKSTLLPPEIEALLKEGVDPNMPNARVCRKKFLGSPLCEAAYFGNAKLANLLLQYAARPNLIFKTEKHWKTPIHLAARARCKNGRYGQVVHALLACKANLNAGGTRRLRYTPLQLALMQKQMHKKHRKTIIDLLSSGSAELNKAVGRNKTTALHIAVRLNDVQSVKLLLAKEADREIKNAAGKTAEDLAIDSNNIHLATAVVFS